ncbi:MAG TPA: HEAT repeat domain-containing protein [Gemmatimonadaceae bacterium]
MDSSLAFARHFARLVWLLLYDSESFDPQMTSLRALVDASRDGAATLVASDWKLTVNGEAVPDSFAGVQDLTAQLIGHSILELTAQHGASPTDLLLVARILASEPVPGDGAHNVLARLRALDARTVHVKVDTLPAPRPVVDGAQAGLKGMISDVSLFTHAPQSGGAVTGGTVGRVAVPETEIVHALDPEQMFQEFSATATPKGSMVKLFEQLDAACTPGAASRALEALLKLAADSVRKERRDIVADVFHGIVRREEEVEDRSVRRQFGIAIRRLSTPTMLKCVVDLLPRRQESYNRYMLIFARTEDVGSEALVDALMEAPSLTDRRVYYDSLLHVRTGIRTLIHILGDARWYVVRNAVDLLGEMRVAEAEGELVRLLEHRDDRVRAAAAGALAKFGASRATPVYTERIAEGMSLGRSAGIAEITGMSVHSLGRAVDREEDGRVQMAMLAALGQLGTPKAIEKLLEIARTDKGLLMKKHPTPLRVAAVHALGQVTSSGALAALQSLLRDKEKAIRGAASWVIMGRRRQQQQGSGTTEGSGSSDPN